jgi:hypothetical protein
MGQNCMTTRFVWRPSGFRPEGEPHPCRRVCLTVEATSLEDPCATYGGWLLPTVGTPWQFLARNSIKALQRLGRNCTPASWLR